MYDEDKAIPHISKELTEWLIGIFPLNPPNPNESYGQLMVRAGAAEVVNKVLHEYKKQQE